MAKRIPILSDEEIALAIEHISQYGCTQERRPMLVAIFTVLANLGLRISEATALRWQDVDLERGEITVRTLKQRKDGKRESTEDTLPINARTAAALMIWKNRGKPEDRIFPISRRVAYNIWQRLLHAANIPPVKLHALRHSAVTRWLEQTQDLAFAQHMARHRSVASTSKYIHCTKLHEKFAAVRPVG